jgi:ABC-type transport system involved in multi-copper enzyme maturation permease subunit
MIGRTVLMELRTGWKGILIVSILVFIIGSSMVMIFPTFRDTFTEELEGADKVDLIIPEEEGQNLTIFWDPVENVESYYVIESNSSNIYNETASIVYIGIRTNITTAYNSSEPKYYAVLATVNGSLFPSLIGIDSTGEGFNPYQELLDSPGYSGFTGGRSIDITTVKGFISLELFSWIWILTGMFMAYFSVSSVTSDFEKKRMDLIFSTPISREQYIIEKFIALSIIGLIFTLMTAFGLMSGVASIGEEEALPHAVSFLSVFSMQTFLMIIAAFGIFLGMVFRGGKAGMGINIAFVFSSFIFLTIAGIAESLSALKYVSIMHYWDYNSMLIDEVFNTGYFFGLLVASLIILIFAIFIFKKRDIPT